jgi:hypothetical protein
LSNDFLAWAPIAFDPLGDNYPTFSIDHRPFIRDDSPPPLPPGIAGIAGIARLSRI